MCLNFNGGLVKPPLDIRAWMSGIISHKSMDVVIYHARISKRK